MSTPTQEARDDAYLTWKQSEFGGYESVQAVVDVVWPLAEARVRQQMVDALRDTERVVAWLRGNPGTSVADYLDSIAKGGPGWLRSRGRG